VESAIAGGFDFFVVARERLIQTEHKYRKGQSGAIPMLIYKQLFVTTAESWYTAPVERCSADVIRCLQLKTPLQDCITSDFKTIWIDLTKSEDELFAAVHRNTRNRIRRADRDNLRYDYWDSPSAEQRRLFCDFFEQNAIHSASARELHRWTAAHAGNGTLDMSRISDEEDRVLVWHAYYRDKQYARGKYSVSLSRDSNSEVRALIGRANRYLTWEDIKRFKKAGLSVYDLGGWYAGRDDAKLLMVNRFKEEWGGQIVTAFHCTRALTFKGRLFLWAADLRARISRIAAQSPEKSTADG
jgi:hypothetical protein